MTPLIIPADLATRTEAQKIAWYRATLLAGYLEADIRAAVESKFGRQTDEDWLYLRRAAAKPAESAQAAGGGMVLLLAAAAAYFLLG
jgi:hypothetical protein